MAYERLQSFIAYLRDNKQMSQKEIVQAVKVMNQLDRRFGQLGLMKGYLTPEAINKITLAQTQLDLKFGEIAVQLGYINEKQAEELLRIQRDELFAFVQATVTAGIMPLPKIVEKVKDYMLGNPLAAGQKPQAKPSVLSEKIRETLKKIKGVAPLPQVVTKVMRMLDDPTISMEDVAKVIMLDVGLSSTLLRIVNSAFYGLRSRATTVTQTLVVLGSKKIKELVLVAGIMEKFKTIPKKYAEAFWLKSIYRGQWSKQIATLFKVEDLDAMFINGLVLDIGELMIIDQCPEEYNQIREKVTAGMPQSQAEREVLGGTHADISAFLFGFWKFPAQTIQCGMLHHHTVIDLMKVKNLTNEVYITNLAAAISDIDQSLDAYEYTERIGKLCADYASLLKKDLSALEDMHADVEIAVKELSNMMMSAA